MPDPTIVTRGPCTTCGKKFKAEFRPGRYPSLCKKCGGKGHEVASPSRPNRTDVKGIRGFAAVARKSKKSHAAKS
jgi:hypothetical protein